MTANIYQIRSGNHVFIGGTSNDLDTALADHVSDFAEYKRCGTRYRSSAVVLEKGDYKIELLEKCAKSDLAKRKGWHQRNLQEGLNLVNEIIVARTEAEKRAIGFSQNNCACGSTYQHHNKSRHMKSKKHQAWEAKQEAN